MSNPKIMIFPVGNGDTTLITTETGNRILIDVNIRAEDSDILDVIKKLKEELKKDNQDRPYVDVFLLSHPDQDHCRGIKEHFHLGDPDNYPNDSDKILIKEMWSSPMVFRRKSKNVDLCEDAQAFNIEARRRVAKFEKDPTNIKDGNKILILGEDKNGKTDGLQRILIKTRQEFSQVNGTLDKSFKALLLAPMPPQNDEYEEEILSKNNSSVVLRITLAAQGEVNACRFLTGGDTGVEIWEKLWSKNEDSSFEYDILLSPHHCSWRSISHESWSKSNGKAQPSKDALEALSQARQGAIIVASSNKIKDDDNDPPCIGAKKEYSNILAPLNGEFCCTGDSHLEILTFEISAKGLQRDLLATTAVPGGVFLKPIPHG